MALGVWEWANGLRHGRRRSKAVSREMRSFFPLCSGLS
jgi:hypothetical protein